MSRKVALVLVLACWLVLGVNVTQAALVGYWPMDEGQGAVAKDISGNGHDGAIAGTPNWVDGPDGFRTALQFGTDSAGINCGRWCPQAATGQVSFSCWVLWNTGGADTYQGIVANRTTWGSDNSQIGWACEVSNGALQFGSRNQSYGLGTLTAGQWQHLAVTFDGTTVLVYINGAQSGSGGGSTFGDDQNSTVRIGCDEDNGNRFNGKMDDVRIYDSILSVSDIAELMLPPVYQTADHPTPSNGAEDVRRDVILGWTAASVTESQDVYFGTSFADVNAASRQSPGTVLVSQGQGPDSYDPSSGMLALNTTYYWRVDEVNGSDIYKGPIWSFTTEPYSYVLTSITATASSSAPGTKPQNTVDGSGLDAADTDGADPKTMWLSNASDTQPWIQFEFDRLYKLSEMWVWNYNAAFEADFLGFGFKTVTLDYSANGTDWATLGDLTFNQAPGLAGYAHNTVIDLSTVAAKYIKLTPKANFNTVGLKQCGLSQVRFFYIPTAAREPDPADQATGVNPSELSLGWRGGREAVTHKLSFSTDSNAVSAGTAVLATTDQTSYAVGSLDLGKTYYWKVDEVNEAADPSVWAGDVWSFSTTNYITVDDMESYNDATDRVFDTWIDGWGTTTNGGVVGYSQTPYMEKAVVHGGKQSMPFAYNNVSTAYSEASRTFASAQDWTACEADTLRLWVQGRPITFAETSPGTIVLSGAGSDIYQLTDQFRFAYKQLTGDGSITARVDSISSTATWAKCGVMIRMGTAVGVMQAHMVACPSNRVEFMPRLTAGSNATGTSTAADSITLPQWVRLTRKSNVFTGEYSADGVTWTQIAGVTPATIAMTDPVLIGLVVNSNNTTSLCETHFSSVSTTGNVTGQWQVAEVGLSPQPPGNTADTLYVKVKDSAGKSVAVKNPDPLACTSATWQEWRIPFTSLGGVSLNRVESLTIGVGDEASPQHGTGLLFIDDIGVGRPAQ